MSSWQGLRIALLILIAASGALSSIGITAEQAGDRLIVELKQYQDSGISGTAVLTETVTGGVHVSMELRGTELAGNHPTHIHSGTCDDFDPNPLYPLETVTLSPVNQEGMSESDVEDVSLASLRNGEFVILVHLSPEQLTNYLVCGDIASGSVTGGSNAAAPEGTASVHDMPGSGSGAGADDDWSRSLLILALGTLAMISAASAIGLKQYRKHAKK